MGEIEMFVDVEEAPRLLGIEVGALRERLADGSIRALPARGREPVRIARMELEAYERRVGIRPKLAVRHVPGVRRADPSGEIAPPDATP